MSWYTSTSSSGYYRNYYDNLVRNSREDQELKLEKKPKSISSDSDHKENNKGGIGPVLFDPKNLVL